MLPTQKSNNVGDIVMRPSDRRLATINVLTIDDPNRNEAINQHLYITSKDEIKDGDWCIREYYPQTKGFTRVVEQFFRDKADFGDSLSREKIIASTDANLFMYLEKFPGRYPLPLIPESFTKVYVNKHNDGKPIVEVDVEMEKYGYCGACKAAGMWHCAHADTCGNSQELWRIKTREDNTIIIHQSKKYSRDEVVKLFDKYLEDSNNPKWSKYSGIYNWLEDNL